MEDSNAEKLYQEAIRLCKNGKFKESSKIFFQIIKHKNSFGCLQKMCDIVIKNPENNSIEKSKAYAYKGGLFCKYKNDLVRGYYNFLEAIKLDSNNFKAFENLKNIFSEIEKKGIEVTLKLKTEKDFLIHKNNILFLIGLYSNLSFLKTECQNNFLSSLFSHRGYLSFNYDNDFDSALKDVKNALEYNKNNVLAKTILNQLQQQYHLDISLIF